MGGRTASDQRSTSLRIGERGSDDFAQSALNAVVHFWCSRGVRSGKTIRTARMSDPTAFDSQDTDVTGLSTHHDSETVEGLPDSVQLPESSNGAKPKRVRGPDWSVTEKTMLLVHCLDALRRPEIREKWHFYVSTQLSDRSPTSCQGEWDTILKKMKAILKAHNKSGDCESFSKMTELEKKELSEKLPEGFLFGWFALMEEIVQAKNIKQTKVTRTTQVLDDNLPSSSTRTIPSITTELTSFPNSQGSPEREPDEKLGIFDRDALVLAVTSHTKKQIEDIIKPLISDLQGQTVDKQKYRDKVLAIEEQKLDLKRKKMDWRRNNMLTDLMGGAGSCRSQAGVAFNTRTSSANVHQMLNYQMPPNWVGHDQLSNVNAELQCNTNGTQAGVPGAHLNFQSNSGYIQYRSSHDDSPSGVMHQPPNVECAAGTMANSNFQTSSASLAYHGQQHTTSYDPPCGVMHQADMSADLYNIPGIEAGFAKRSWAYGGQPSFDDELASNQDQDFFDFLAGSNTV